MTIDEAVFLVDELKPNQIEKARKIEWLSRLDERLFREVICTHALEEEPEKGPPMVCWPLKRPGDRTERDLYPHPEEMGEPLTFTPYTQATPGDTELIAKAPYDELYRFYLEMHIDLANLEYNKYNNSAQLYGNALGQYKRWYHRTHRPLAQPEKHRF